MSRAGRLLHNVGAATMNDRSPSVLFDLLRVYDNKRPLLDVRKLKRPGVVIVISSCMVQFSLLPSSWDLRIFDFRNVNSPPPGK